VQPSSVSESTPTSQVVAGTVSAAGVVLLFLVGVLYWKRSVVAAKTTGNRTVKYVVGGSPLDKANDGCSPLAHPSLKTKAKIAIHPEPLFPIVGAIFGTSPRRVHVSENENESENNVSGAGMI